MRETINIPQFSITSTQFGPNKLVLLIANRDQRAAEFAAHIDPGGLTPSEKYAFELDDHALQLRLQAAQIRLEAEEELLRLLQHECHHEF